MRVMTEAIQGQLGKVERLVKEAHEFLGWKHEFVIRHFDIFDFENLSQAELEAVKERVLSTSHRVIHQNVDGLLTEHAFRCRQVTGQYNEKEEMIERMMRQVLGFEHGCVHHSELIMIENISDHQFEAFKQYYLNPVEKVEVAFDAANPVIQTSAMTDLAPINGFLTMDDEALKRFGTQFAMDFDDLKLCQSYFQKEEREPNLTELKVIDTYWSDHCRHTTFNTHLNDIEIEEGEYAPLFEVALADYLQKRQQIQRSDRPITLMDLATIQAKYLKANHQLEDVEISAEINACALEIKVDVEGTEEDWLLYFKNETHNHPTEIEPFGGASTCIGGGVRDPLSGRSWVYQAMRLGGGMDPNQPWEDVRQDKLPQRFISKMALEGYADYANQYGVTASFNEEIYHPGFEAKRMELGALISAAPRENVVREEPQASDYVVLLGGRTGRDGLGAAVGSSKIQTETSLETAGAEVQKGNASIERKIGRLFRNGDAVRLIKRCNDFGAGGVSVAVGELADGLMIDLDKFPTKYPGMHGGEIALSESQERMAVVVSKEDVDTFMHYCTDEDVEATIIAEVTSSKRMVMHWQGQKIVDLSREFLNTNGAEKVAAALLVNPTQKPFDKANFEFTKENVMTFVQTLAEANQQAMDEQFDASIGRGTVLYPYGGKFRATKELGMISRLPVNKGATQTTSAMAYGYHPYLAERSPFHGGYYAVVESIARLVAMGFDYRKARLSFQEYFESLGNDPKAWGKPVLALLGANEVMSALGLAAIGGKDSMSGTFKELTVPPTLVSFAVTTGSIKQVLSRAFKKPHHPVVLVESVIQEDGTLDLNNFKTTLEKLHQLAAEGKLVAVSTVGVKGLLSELLNMAYGNQIGIQLNETIAHRLTEAMMGSFVVEVEDLTDLEGLTYQVIGQTQVEMMSLADVHLKIADIHQANKQVLASVYDLIEKPMQIIPASVNRTYSEQVENSQPRVLIAVTLGANTEYDLRDAFEAAGFETGFHIIQTSNHEVYQQSVAALAAKLKDFQVLAFASGYVFANEPSEVGLAWDLFLQDEVVQQAITQHLEAKGLIYGAGSAGASLIRSGLIEFGRFQKGTQIQVKQNPYGKFIADIIPSTLVSNQSAWVNKVTSPLFSTAVATAWGRIDLGNKADELLTNGQVLSVFNEYHNAPAVDAMTSPDGLVFASVSNPERMGQDLYVNIEIASLPPFIQSARQYFN
ncbi:phosphoribosylformylglycinamidine synthase [Globicatella sanguinis]|uniref:phosphoribosylformylglycinamidine synthase n=1 Tax=Globicatella sanguinis TaxID=13076 RepID=UPI00254398EA|nr:phosphoribosylformylglycinamidine synthase [Globicatella sanguinis]MDK7631394.1 phosphoribosylformylglycinamidine synthase [Globicatella sanguinis]WIK65939.1 phosphoribosylformylglycinamidine synthase [Globicatella sanguinis]WKT55344.1 phosphoribosylformylglycinamidine synthase [Globicatella sanguinis]